MNLIEETPLKAIGEQLIIQLSAITDRCRAEGFDVTMIVTGRDEDDGLSVAIGSTIEDHEEFMETMEEVIDDLVSPYAVDDDESEQGPTLQ